MSKEAKRKSALFDEFEVQLAAENEFLALATDFISRRGAAGSVSIADLVDLAEATVARGDIFSMLLQGLPGHGKTTFALLFAREYFKRRYRGEGWYHALSAVEFDPLTITAKIVRHIMRGKTVKLLVFDDAGTWLSKWGVTREKRFFLEFFNLLREAVGMIIFTDVYSIQKYVRDIVKVRGIVRKLSRDEVAALNLDTSKEWSRVRLYATTFSFHGPRWRRLADIIYPLHLPPWLRSKYRKKRLKYTARLAKRVIAHLTKTDIVKRALAEGDEEVIALVRELAQDEAED